MTKLITICLFAILSACAGAIDSGESDGEPEPLQCETSSPYSSVCSDAGCSSIKVCNRDPGDEFGPAVKCVPVEGEKNTFKCSW